MATENGEGFMPVVDVNNAVPAGTKNYLRVKILNAVTGGVESVTGTAVTGGTAENPVVSPTSGDIPDSSTVGGADVGASLNLINSAFQSLPNSNWEETDPGDAAFIQNKPSSVTDFDVTDLGSAKIISDAERTNLSNQSGNNTGDQDLSGLQVKPAEGPFVDGDKTKLDGIEALAEVNNISDANATDLTDGGETTLHTHPAQAGTYADLHRSSIGNQKIKNVIEALEFNSAGPSSGAVADTGADDITVPTAGDYSIVFSGSAKIKKDVLYSFSVVINGGGPIPLGNIESASDNYLRTFSYAMPYTLAASDEVQIYAITDSGTDKDFYMQVGTSFTIVKL